MSHPARLTRRAFGALGGLAVAAALAACSPSDAGEPATSGPVDDAADPVTVTHAFGETTVSGRPKRIVTLGWYSGDVVAALGEVPVGIEDFTWGNVDTYLPWFKDKVTELGGTLPEVLKWTDAGEYDYEQILGLAPDLIIARHGGLDETAYKRLSEIAPTIAQVGSTWSSDRTELTTTIGRVLGKEQEAKDLLAEADKAIDTTAAAHPEFKGVVSPTAGTSTRAPPTSTCTCRATRGCRCCSSSASPSPRTSRRSVPASPRASSPRSAWRRCPPSSPTSTSPGRTPTRTSPAPWRTRWSPAGPRSRPATTTSSRIRTSAGPPPPLRC